MKIPFHRHQDHQNRTIIARNMPACVAASLCQRSLMLTCCQEHQTSPGLPNSVLNWGAGRPPDPLLTHFRALFTEKGPQSCPKPNPNPPKPDPNRFSPGLKIY